MQDRGTTQHTNDWAKEHAGTSVPASPELLQDYEKFKDLLLCYTGLDLSRYKFEQTYRRIWTMVERANLHRFTDYFCTLRQDESHLRAFVDSLTINVSELFRNPDRFEILRLRVLPELLRRNKVLSLWSAGCSYGAEAYSLAILLHEIAPDRPHSILCTDIDGSALERAMRGFFEETDMNHVPQAYRSTYFRACPEGGRILYEAAPFLQQYFVFRQHNLLAEPYQAGFDLIACRNVVIYFLEEAKDQVLRRFQAALQPGGYLFVGSSERIFNYREVGFDYLEPGFYQKPLHVPVQAW